MISGIVASSQVRSSALTPGFLAYATPNGVATTVDIRLQGPAYIDGVLKTTGTHTINTSGTTPIEIRNDNDLGEDLIFIKFITDAFSDIDIQNATSLTTLNIDNIWSGGMCMSLTKLTSFNMVNSHNITSFMRAWSDCYDLPSFPYIDTSSGTNFERAWSNCTSAICLTNVDTTKQTNTSNMFWGNSKMINPNASEKTQIENGFNYVNANPCPPLTVLDQDNDGNPDTVISTVQSGDTNITISKDSDSINIDLDGDGIADIIIPKK